MRMDIDDDVQEVFAEVYQAQSAETLPAGSPLRQSVEFGNKSKFFYLRKQNLIIYHLAK